jgi:hypothetical protein
VADRLSPVLAAVRTQVEALGLTLAGDALPVLLRRAAIRRQGLDPAAMVTVAKSAQPEQTTRRRFGLWATAYVIDVVVHAPYLGPDGDVSQYATMRDTIVDLLKRPPLAGAPEVFEMDAQGADWLRPEGQKTEYDWFACQVTATVAHS